MDLTIFESPQFGAVRTAGTADNPQFCLTDVCKALGLSSKGVNQRLSKEVISNYPLETAGGTQQALFVNEDGLYDVILESRKPEAKAFRKWITSEVLPSIRKTGGYIAASDNDTPEVIMARALMVADETMKRQKAIIQAKDEQINAQREEINSLAPMADYTKEVLQSDSTYTLTQVSKDLGFRSVYTFQDWAKGKGILYKQSGQWLPTAKYSGKGYFTTRTAKYVKNNNEIGSSISTVVTESGRLFLHYVKDNKD